MKTLMVTTLIAFGVIWLIYAMIMPKVVRSSALSDAVALESDLDAWATKMISQGKLDTKDVDEILSKERGLLLGGENPTHSFEDMIEDIVYSSAPPVFPGVIAIIVGIMGAVCSSSNSQIKKPAEQDVG